jgi:glycosyltransferase involved in cell wall biosynthesis
LNNILFFGELSPKTIHGASISNRIITEKLSSYCKVTIIEEYSPLLYHEKFSLKKNILFLSSFSRFFFRCVFFKYCKYYGVIYLSKFGILKNLFLAISFKIFNPTAKVVLHFHRSDLGLFLNKRFNAFLFKLLDKFTDNYIVLSSSQSDQLVQISRNKTFVLANTIELEIPSIDYNFIKTLTVKGKKATIKALFISNFIKDKGIIELLIASKKINSSDFPFSIKLECFGEFTDFEIQNEINSLIKNDSNIIFNKPIRGIDKFLKIQQSHLLLLPSKNEGLPLILLESLSQSIPIIITKVGFIPEVLGNDYSYYCEPENVDSIITAINNYFNDFNIVERDKLFEKYKPYSSESHTLKLKEIFTHENINCDSFL